MSVEEDRRANEIRLSARILPSVFFLVCIIFLSLPALAEISEPTTYRVSNYFTQTPETLTGATVVGADELKQLLESVFPVLIDVTPAARRPKSLPKDRLWRIAPRNSIAGGVWLPNVGYGWLSPDFEDFFRDELEALTQRDKKQHLVFYCLPNCWQSWNAAKRALEFGYVNVAWFPGGSPEWEVFSYPLEKKKPLAMPLFGDYK